MFAIVLAVLSAMLFAGAAPAGKVMLASLPPFQLAGLFYLGAALGVSPLIVKSAAAREPWSFSATTFKRLSVALIFGGVLAPVFLLLGLKAASASSVSMWLTLEAVFTAVIARLVFREHLGKVGWISVALATGAAVLLSMQEGTSGLLAGCLSALACLCWGIDNNSTAIIDGISPARITFLKGLAAGSTNFILGMIFEPHVLTLETIGQALLVGALAYGLSLTLYITAAQQLGATRSQMIFATAPFFGVVFSAIFLREALTGMQFAAGGVMGLAIYLLMNDQHAHHHEHEEMEHIHMHSHDDEHHNHSHPGQPQHLRHSHWHHHQPHSHTHPHWPDLHHRHNH
ncbi:MAG: EamA/RhaT family transporter [Candidatus Melainabacteria bacterium]|nr:MAG: EamA/RhaT family transporter [Candidatus Melainabacteria bacterium]